MSTIIEGTEKMFKGVNVMRNTFPSTRIFVDIHIFNDGFAGYAVWQTNTFRIPGFSHLRDYLSRRNRGQMDPKQAAEEDERNFFFNYDEIQGIVSHAEHKELQLLTSTEQFSIHFRWDKDYDEFIVDFSEKVEKKIFSRDDVEVKASVYI